MNSAQYVISSLTFVLVAVLFGGMIGSRVNNGDSAFVSACHHVGGTVANDGRICFTGTTFITR